MATTFTGLKLQGDLGKARDRVTGKHAKTTSLAVGGKLEGDTFYLGCSLQGLKINVYINRLCIFI